MGSVIRISVGRIDGMRGIMLVGLVEIFYGFLSDVCNVFCYVGAFVVFLFKFDKVVKCFI